MLEGCCSTKLIKISLSIPFEFGNYAAYIYRVGFNQVGVLSGLIFE